VTEASDAIPDWRRTKDGHHFSTTGDLDPLPHMGTAEPFAGVLPEFPDADLGHMYTW